MLDWLPAIVIFIYLAIVLYIGVFAFRKGKDTGEDFFLASRSVGSIVFFLALFATNMTAFAILGSSGMSYKIGLGVFGMMATSSALVIPLTLFFIGTRLWAVGKRFGHMTQVAFFRDRYECSHIGTLIFLLTAAMLIPYLIISIDGGGTILSSLTSGKISYPVGGLIVAVIVMATVFFGGLRGAVWVNVLQTLLFIAFGLVAFGWIGAHLEGGFTGTVNHMLADPSNKVPNAPAMAKMQTLLTRERIPWQMFLSFMLIPLSSIMFPHMSIMCFTAKRVTAFKKTVIWYPLCIMAIWLPCCFLGALGPGQEHVRDRVAAKSESFQEWLEHQGNAEHGRAAGLTPALEAAEKAGANPKATPPAKGAAVAAASVLRDVQQKHDWAPADRAAMAHRIYSIRSRDVQQTWGKLATQNSDSVLLEMLKVFVPAGLAGILAAGIISAVMGSDCHQILGLSTMFTKDVFTYYGGERVSEHATVFMGRAFILIANGIAYVIALGRPPIFELAVTYAFSGFAALAPMMIAALFWRRSTKWAALANTLWVAAWVVFMVFAEQHFKANEHVLGNVLFMNPAGKLTFAFGFTPVVPMTLGAAVLVWIVSLITPAPSRATIERYFRARRPAGAPAFAPAVAAGNH
ncbi:MAG TPA: sodium:solute symporter family protein [Tepidisphaeraceae bacterium]|nr:sodium:solute symporter family protein [Tepidisphaeraceae bacterium]